MQNIGDFVIHQETGLFGKVVGYGHQIVDAIYQPTLKVKVAGGSKDLSRERFAEDLSSAWQQLYFK